MAVMLSVVIFERVPSVVEGKAIVRICKLRFRHKLPVSRSGVPACAVSIRQQIVVYGVPVSLTVVVRALVVQDCLQV